MTKLAHTVPLELRTQLQVLPQSAGIYMFLDASAEVLYLGKSINIRRRAASYFHGDLQKRDSRHQRLVLAIRQLRHFRCSSNLLALLLEDTLIKSYNPPYNIRQKKYKGYQYMRFTRDRYPRLESLMHGSGAGDELFGPFPDGFFVERLEAFLGRYFGLRNCREKNPSKICLQADLGLCLAPCVDTEVGEAYAKMIVQVRTFLRGESERILSRIKSMMATAVEHEQFETAARCRDDLRFAASIQQRQAFLHQFANMTLIIKDLRSSAPVYHFQKGNLIRLKKRGGPLPGDRALLESSTIKDRRFLLDRAYLIFSWLKRHRHSSEYQFLIS